MTDAVPPDVMGLWRREVITAPGFRDETTQVLWLQTSRWYADLRVKVERPGPRSPDGFAVYSDEELVALAAVQGFAGVLTAGDGTCFWRRDLDHQPAGPLPDEARYEIKADVLIEDGIHADYQEIWRGVPASEGPYAAFRLVEGDGRSGLLVVAGRHMIEFVARPGPAPEGDSLAQLVAREIAEGRREAAEALLDTRVRYATLEDGVWTTSLSSKPWLEGRPMWPKDALHFNVPSRAFEITQGGVRLTATLLEASAPLDVISRLLEGDAAVSAATQGAV